MVDGKLTPYRGRLTAAEVAFGMDAAARNARRLASDAQLLFDAGRYPTSFSIASLSIEESGKVSILRHISVSNDGSLKKRWADFRNHKSKNLMWIFRYLVSEGAKTLDDFSKIFNKDSDHGALLDSLKQLGLYTDCYGNRHWSEPHEVIDEKLAQGILEVAKILAPKRETSAREMELWMLHLTPHWDTAGMRHAIVRFLEAMHQEGLLEEDLVDARRFYGLEEGDN